MLAAFWPFDAFNKWNVSLFVLFYEENYYLLMYSIYSTLMLQNTNANLYYRNLLF